MAKNNTQGPKEAVMLVLGTIEDKKVRATIERLLGEYEVVVVELDKAKEEILQIPDLKKSMESLSASLKAQERAGSETTLEIAKLKKDIEARDREITALRLVNETVAEDSRGAKKLSVKEREFTASWTEQDRSDSKKTVKKTGKFLLEDVSKIYVSGRKYSASEFMASKEAQSAAAASSHKLIKKL